MSKKQGANQRPYLLRDRNPNVKTHSSSVTGASNSVTRSDQPGSGASSGKSSKTFAEKVTAATAAVGEPNEPGRGRANINMAPTPDADTVSHAEFVKSMDTIIEKLDLLNTNITTMRNEMEFWANIADLQASAADSDARLRSIENSDMPNSNKKCEKLKTDLNQKILALEIHERKMNLLIYGIEKKQDERILQVVRNAIEQLGFSNEEVQRMFFANTHRLPRRFTQGSEQNGSRGHDLIIVRFGSMFERDRVLSKAHLHSMTHDREGRTAPRQSTRFVMDLPASLKRKRFELEQRAYLMRKSEDKSTHIRLVGTNLQLE